MKIDPKIHKNIFYIVCLLFVVAIIAAASLAQSDRAMHLSNYERYTTADEQFKDREFATSYEEYKRLSAIYKEAYVLELKMAVCAMNLGLWGEAVEHSRRSLELYPLLAKDQDFMDSLSYSLSQLGDDGAAALIDDYYYNFVLNPDRG